MKCVKYDNARKRKRKPETRRIEEMKTNLFVLIMVSLFLTAIPISYVKAGSSAISPVSVHDTTLSISFSHVDMLYWEDEISIPVSLSVTFENQSIISVSIWEIRVGLYEITANPTPYDHESPYASGGNLSHNPYSNPLYVVENPSESKFATLDFTITNIWWQSIIEKSVEAKIYLEVSLTLIGENSTRYPMILYTGSGEQPIVTIRARSADYTLPLAIGGAVLGIVAICIAVIIVSKQRKS